VRTATEQLSTACQQRNDVAAAASAITRAEEWSLLARDYGRMALAARRSEIAAGRQPAAS